MGQIVFWNSREVMTQHFWQIYFWKQKLEIINGPYGPISQFISYKSKKIPLVA